MHPEDMINNFLLGGRLPHLRMKDDFFRDSIKVTRGDCGIEWKVDDILDRSGIENIEHGREGRS